MKGAWLVSLRGIGTGPFFSPFFITDVPAALLLVLGLRIGDLYEQPVEFGLPRLQAARRMFATFEAGLDGLPCCSSDAVAFLDGMIAQCQRLPLAIFWVREDVER